MRPAAFRRFFERFYAKASLDRRGTWFFDALEPAYIDRCNRQRAS